MPLDDRVPTMSRIEQKIRPDAAVEIQKIQNERETADGSALDKTYVTKFLKEIDEIENINHRAGTYIEDRTMETRMRRGEAAV